MPLRSALAMFVVVIVVVSACHRDAAEREAPSVPAPVVAPAPAPSAPVREATSRRAPRALAPTVAAEARSAVREGRSLAAQGKHTEALARFERALTLASSPRLQCEAGYVAFRAEQRARARELVERALHVMLARRVTESRRVTTAMCLYNAGLVLEADGKHQEALDAYTKSLELRSHPTVQQHADAMRTVLASRAVPPRSDHSNVSFVAASLPSVRSHVMEAFCRETGLGPCVLSVSSDEPPNDDVEPVTITIGDEVPTGTANGLDAQIVRAAASYDEYVYLVTRVQNRYTLAHVGNAYNPGAFGIYGESEVKVLRYEDVIPGGAAEIIAVVASGTTDNDMAGCEFTDSSQTLLVVCTVVADSPRCIDVHLADTVVSGNNDLEGCDEIMRGENARAEESRGYELSYRFSDGSLVLSASNARYHDVAPLGPGSYRLTELFNARNAPRP